MSMREKVRTAAVELLKSHNLIPAFDSPFTPEFTTDSPQIFAAYARSEAPASQFQDTLRAEFREITLDIVCWVVGANDYANKIDKFDPRVHQIFHRNQKFDLDGIVSVNFQQFQIETPEQVAQKTLCLGRWSFGVIFTHNQR